LPGDVETARALRPAVDAEVVPRRADRAEDELGAPVAVEVGGEDDGRRGPARAEVRGERDRLEERLAARPAARRAQDRDAARAAALAGRRHDDVVAEVAVEVRDRDPAARDGPVEPRLVDH